MTPTLNMPVPLLLDVGRSTVEEIAILCVSALVAITVSAESQAFVATFLGDNRTEPGKRHHFNAFLHLDPLGALCYFLAGFGWAKEVPVERANFKHPRFYFLLCRLAGPLGNFLMANIAASLIWILGGFGWEDKVFSGLLVVNMMTAVYGLLVIPPLPGSAILSVLLPDTPLWQAVLRYVRFAGPYLLVGGFLLMRLQYGDLSGGTVNSFVRTCCTFLQNFTL